MKNLKFVIAPDSFKGSMSAKVVCTAVEKGLMKIFPTAKFVHVPMADGGEGTLQSLIDANDGILHTKTVTGPLGTPVIARFGFIAKTRTGVIEMAEASGIGYVTKQTANPRRATTYGTGELIMACLDLGAEQIILGIGGSATNDGGAGMAQALGVKLLDKAGAELGRGGEALSLLDRIDLSGRDPRLLKTTIMVASDVKNVLCGPSGASHVYGPQKGATPDDVVVLDRCLKHYAGVIRNQLDIDIVNEPGSGAGGGIGAGLLAFTHCLMQPGISIVVEATQLKLKLLGADYCITGEGGIDGQTKFGKTPFGVAQAARECAVPVIALAGYIGEGSNELYDHGIDAIFGIVPGASDIESLMKNGPENVARTAENIGRLLKLERRLADVSC